MNGAADLNRRRQAQQWLVAGVEQHQAGQLAAAESLYFKVLAFDPDNADAVYLAGIVALQQGRHPVAVRRLCLAASLRPDHGEGTNNLGVALGHQGENRASARWARRAVILMPALTTATNNLVDALKRYSMDAAAAEDWGACVRACRLVLALRPTDLESVNRMVSALNAEGNARKAADEPEAAAAAYAAVLKLAPGVTETRYNLALLYLEQRNYAAAGESLRRVLRQRADLPEAWVGLARVAGADKQDARARRCLKFALALDPADNAAWNLLGLAWPLPDGGVSAVACWRRGLAVAPGDPDILSNLGRGLHMMGELDAAVSCYTQALEHDPAHCSAHWNLALALLTLCRFMEGWEHYEWRWKFPDNPPPALPVPAWDGGPLAGKTILVHCEQGLGDSLHFIRYVTPLKARGARIVVLAPPALADLFRRLPDIDQVAGNGRELPPCDLKVPLLSLPRLLPETGDIFTPPTPYLSADPVKVSDWRRRIDARLRPADTVFAAGGVFKAATSPLRIGLVWRGGAAYANDHIRSLSAGGVAGLTDTPGTVWVILQKDAPADEVQRFTGKANVVDLSRELADFSTTAAIVAGLDLVISVDTAVLHLAGGLGIAAWGLLPHAADWRWQCRRADSPWYPSCRLFRQPAQGDWASVVAAVDRALRQLFGGRGRVM